MRRQMLVAVCASTVAVSPSAAIAQTAPGAGATAPTARDITVVGDKAKSKKVCKSSTATGSIMQKRECRLKSEWDEINQRSLATLAQIKDERRRRQHVADMLANAGQ